MIIYVARRNIFSVFNNFHCGLIGFILCTRSTETNADQPLTKKVEDYKTWKSEKKWTETITGGPGQGLFYLLVFFSKIETQNL